MFGIEFRNDYNIQITEEEGIQFLALRTQINLSIPEGACQVISVPGFNPSNPLHSAFIFSTLAPEVFDLGYSMPDNAFLYISSYGAGSITCCCSLGGSDPSTGTLVVLL